MSAPNPAARPSIAVSIPTFNGRHLLAQTLPSVLGAVRTQDRVIVVDDGSTDGTLDWLGQAFPTVDVVPLGRNQGIAVALNACVEAAAECEFIALLNNDVELSPDALDLLAARLDSDPGLAAVAPKMLNYFTRGELDGAGDTYCRLGTAHRRGQGRTDDGRFDTPEPVFGVCAGAGLYRASALQDVGRFDEDFFAYYEDVDWNYRANLAGYRCWYEPAARVFHMSSATVGAGLHEFTGYHCWRNAIWVVAKNWSREDLLKFWWLLVLGQCANVIIAVRSGLVLTLLRAWRDALLGLPRMIARRPTRPARRVAVPWVVLQLGWFRSGRR